MLSATLSTPGLPSASSGASRGASPLWSEYTCCKVWNWRKQNLKLLWWCLSLRSHFFSEENVTILFDWYQEFVFVCKTWQNFCNLLVCAIFRFSKVEFFSTYFSQRLVLDRGCYCVTPYLSREKSRFVPLESAKKKPALDRLYFDDEPKVKEKEQL